MAYDLFSPDMQPFGRSIFGGGGGFPTREWFNPMLPSVGPTQKGQPSPWQMFSSAPRGGVPVGPQGGGFGGGRMPNETIFAWASRVAQERRQPQQRRVPFNPFGGITPGVAPANNSSSMSPMGPWASDFANLFIHGRGQAFSPRTPVPSAAAPTAASAMAGDMFGGGLGYDPFTFAQSPTAGSNWALTPRNLNPFLG